MSTPEGVDAYPLSPMQRGMLLHSVATGAASDLYVEQLTCELRGELNATAFRAAWEQLTARHAVLRTACAWQNLPEPLQVVGPRIRLPFEVQDWESTPESERGERLEKLRAQDRLEGFKLSRAPLWRCKVIRLSEQDHRLIWTWHHLILDAWSVPLLLEQLFTAYESERLGQRAPLPESRPFKDFVLWQAARGLRAAEEFWRRRLEGFTEPTPLPSPAPQTLPAGGSSYGLEFIELPKSDVAAVLAAARRYRITPNTLVQGAWALLLSRYSGREDVLFGVAVSGRAPELSGMETMIGLTINTAPMRARVTENQRAVPWLQALQQTQAESQPHEHAPLREVQRWSSMPGGGTLFDTLLAFENYPVDLSSLRGGSLELIDFDFVERADFPFTVTLTLREEGKLGAGFDLHRFERSWVLRLLGHLQTLLLGLAQGDELRLVDIPMLPAAEEQQLLEWSRGTPPRWRHAAREGQPIHRLFELQVAQTPDAVALTFAGPQGDEVVTYAALNAAANRLARELQQRGVAVESRVAVCLEGSLAQIVAILGVLKAGGAYVPMSPTSPDRLLREMAADADIELMLTDETQAAELSTRVARPSLAVRHPSSTKDDADGSNLATTAEAQNLAYLIFTSGSTGKPKAVAVSHHSLSGLVAAQVEAFQIDEESHVLNFSSLTFDASVSEIFTALLSGAQLFLAPRHLLVPSRDLVSLMDRWGITTVTFPPSVLSRLPAAELPALQVLVSAGEACPPSLVARWGTGRTFLNAYGPTEATVCATIGTPLSDGSAPTIGRPMGETRVYLLDRHLRPAPLGVIGELYLGGEGVARAYWNRADLTAASFLPDPFSERPGRRLYRTGDHGRFLPNGEIELIGRMDDQVKVRGFRIELGQVEAALRRDPAIREAAVLADGDSAADRALVAYVVPKQGEHRDQPRPEWWPSIAEYLVYDELAYHAMTSDERRNESYRAAMRRLVPGRVVLEVGTGPEALLARFCIEAGARRVYAVEMLAATYEKACRRVTELGLTDRIIVIHGDATKVTLPEPAELCVSEIVGAIGGCEGAAVILNGVRPLLTPEATMIPERSATYFAPVELPEELRENLAFPPLPARYVEKIFEQIGAPFDLRLSIRGARRSDLLAEPRLIEDLDFSAPVPTAQENLGTFHCTRAGKLGGFLVWLTLETGGGELIDILEHEHCWLPVYFPVFDPELHVEAGDLIEAKAGWRLHEDGLHPDYFVEGTVRRAGCEDVAFSHYSPHHSQVFRGSPFYRRFFAETEVPKLPIPEAFDESTLRARLRLTLPEQMIPSAFVRMDALPLNSSGKVDRRALSAHRSSAPTAAAARSDGPQNEAEQLVAEIWSELLRLPNVSREMNFFDHGGHSLMLLEVQERLRSRGGVELPITDLFKFPTVESLARQLGQSAAAPLAALHAATKTSDRISARRGALAGLANLKASLKHTLKDPVKTSLKDVKSFVKDNTKRLSGRDPQT